MFSIFFLVKLRKRNVAVDIVQLVQIRATLAKKIHTEHVSWE